MASSASPALLFIPDISGFTRFVNETEISHSQILIQELLETLIDSDSLGLKVSEIEGDAILFYRPGEAPDPQALVEQATRMFIAFHQCLRSNEHRRICPCQACKGAVDLTLKFVIHQGTISLIKVKDREKLFGSDVILAHRLLKNQVPSSEYLLATQDLHLDRLQPAPQYPWFTTKPGSESYDAGAVSYHFASLEPLRAQVPEPARAPLRQFRNDQPLQFMRRVEASTETLFPLLADVVGRARFIPGAQSIRIEDARHNHIIRQGMVYESVIDGKTSKTVVSGAQVTPDRLVLSETDLDEPVTTDWIVERDGAGSRIEIAVHTAFSSLARLGFALFGQRKLVSRIEHTLENLQRLAEASP